MQFQDAANRVRYRDYFRVAALTDFTFRAGLVDVQNMCEGLIRQELTIEFHSLTDSPEQETESAGAN